MKIVIVDDDDIVRMSLKMILEAQDVEVVATGKSGEEAVQLYAQYQPDILLSDIRMSGKTGIEAAYEITKQFPDARILFLTTFSDDEYVIAALKCRARGYILKQDYESILPAVRAVYSGQSVFGGEIIDKIPVIGKDMAQAGEVQAKEATQMTENVQNRGAVHMAGDIQTGEAVHMADDALTTEEAQINNRMVGIFEQQGITEKEYEIIVLAAEGYNNREIAAKLYLSEGTVRNYVSSILDKLQLRDRTQLVVYYYKHRSST